jgi:hypothetical protein
VALQVLTNLGRLSSRRWQSFPTAPDGTAKKTKHFTITKICLLMLLKETIPVYTENHTVSINTNCNITDKEVG